MSSSDSGSGPGSGSSTKSDACVARLVPLNSSSAAAALSLHLGRNLVATETTAEQYKAALQSLEQDDHESDAPARQGAFRLFTSDNSVRLNCKSKQTSAASFQPLAVCEIIHCPAAKSNRDAPPLLTVLLRDTSNTKSIFVNQEFIASTQSHLNPKKLHPVAMQQCHYEQHVQLHHGSRVTMCGLQYVLQFSDPLQCVAQRLNESIELSRSSTQIQSAVKSALQFNADSQLATLVIDNHSQDDANAASTAFAAPNQNDLSLIDNYSQSDESDSQSRDSFDENENEPTLVIDPQTEPGACDASLPFSQKATLELDHQHHQHVAATGASARAPQQDLNAVNCDSTQDYSSAHAPVSNAAHVAAVASAAPHLVVTPQQQLQQRAIASFDPLDSYQMPDDLDLELNEAEHTLGSDNVEFDECSRESVMPTPVAQLDTTRAPPAAAADAEAATEAPSAALDAAESPARPATTSVQTHTPATPFSPVLQSQVENESNDASAPAEADVAMRIDSDDDVEMLPAPSRSSAESIPTSRIASPIKAQASAVQSSSSLPQQRSVVPPLATFASTSPAKPLAVDQETAADPQSESDDSAPLRANLAKSKAHKKAPTRARIESSSDSPDEAVDRSHAAAEPAALPFDQSAAKSLDASVVQPETSLPCASAQPSQEATGKDADQDPEPEQNKQPAVEPEDESESALISRRQVNEPTDATFDIFGSTSQIESDEAASNGNVAEAMQQTLDLIQAEQQRQAQAIHRAQSATDQAQTNAQSHQMPGLELNETPSDTSASGNSIANAPRAQTPVASPPPQQQQPQQEPAATDNLAATSASPQSANDAQPAPQPSASPVFDSSAPTVSEVVVLAARSKASLPISRLGRLKLTAAQRKAQTKAQAANKSSGSKSPSKSEAEQHTKATTSASAAASTSAVESRTGSRASSRNRSSTALRHIHQQKDKPAESIQSAPEIDHSVSTVVDSRMSADAPLVEAQPPGADSTSRSRSTLKKTAKTTGDIEKNQSDNPQQQQDVADKSANATAQDNSAPESPKSRPDLDDHQEAQAAPAKTTRKQSLAAAKSANAAANKRSVAPTHSSTNKASNDAQDQTLNQASITNDSKKAHKSTHQSDQQNAKQINQDEDDERSGSDNDQELPSRPRSSRTARTKGKCGKQIQETSSKRKRKPTKAEVAIQAEADADAEAEAEVEADASAKAALQEDEDTSRSKKSGLPKGAQKRKSVSENENENENEGNEENAPPSKKTRTGSASKAAPPVPEKAHLTSKSAKATTKGAKAKAKKSKQPIEDEDVEMQIEDEAAEATGGLHRSNTEVAVNVLTQLSATKNAQQDNKEDSAMQIDTLDEPLNSQAKNKKQKSKALSASASAESSSAASTPAKGGAKSRGKASGAKAASKKGAKGKAKVKQDDPIEMSAPEAAPLAPKSQTKTKSKKGKASASSSAASSPSVAAAAPAKEVEAAPSPVASAIVYPSLLFTGQHLDSDQLQAIQSNESLEMQLVSEATPTTILVVNKVRRTAKFLAAYNIVQSIVEMSWVDESIAAGHWLPIEGFELRDEENEARFEFSLANRVQHKDFAAKSAFYFTPSVVPPCDELTSIVNSCAGRVVKKPPKKVNKSLIIVASLKDEDQCVTLHQEGYGLAQFHTEQLILNGVLRQKLQKDAHRLQLPSLA